jgi:quercetin 2,3-dioxygenase
VSRPDNVVNVADIEAEKRPRGTSAPGVGAWLRSLGNRAGLTRMGVHQRTVSPGLAGTIRHFHSVEEEWAYVLSGQGKLRLGPLTLEVRAGHFAAFPPGPSPHHFINDGEEDLVILEGGESRGSEDTFWYPDLKLMSTGRKFTEHYDEPPPEEGDASRVVHIDDVAVRQMQHDVDRDARRTMRSLHKGTGLERQAVVLASVKAGDRTTAFHTHDRTDEWVFILAGSAVGEIGDERFEIRPGDFIGYPAGGPPHLMQAKSELTYLMGGQIDGGDVVVYPRDGKQRVGGKLGPL